MCLVRGLEDIVVDSDIVAQESQFVLHVLEETSDEGSKMNDMRRLVFRKKRFGRCRVPDRSLASAFYRCRKPYLTSSRPRMS